MDAIKAEQAAEKRCCRVVVVDRDAALQCLEISVNVNKYAARGRDLLADRGIVFDSVV